MFYKSITLKYFLSVVCITSIAFYFFITSSSLEQEQLSENITDTHLMLNESSKAISVRELEDSDAKPKFKETPNETITTQNVTIDYSNIQLERGYQTKEYYLYDMYRKCRSFVHQNIQTTEEFDDYLITIFEAVNYTDSDRTFDTAMRFELEERFKVCIKILDKNIIILGHNIPKILLERAVTKRDTFALASKAFDEVISNKKEISDIKYMLVEALLKNNSEALYTLSMLVRERSDIQNKYLVSSALLSRACDAGYTDCGYNSLTVQLACEEKSICGSNLQETLRMIVPSELSNKYENIVNEITFIKTQQQWNTFFNVTFGD